MKQPSRHGAVQLGRGPVHAILACVVDAIDESAALPPVLLSCISSKNGLSMKWRCRVFGELLHRKQIDSVQRQMGFDNDGPFSDDYLPVAHLQQALPYWYR
jgi:hypothetical protein